MKHSAIKFVRKYENYRENFYIEVIGNIYDNPELLKGGEAE